MDQDCSTGLSLCLSFGNWTTTREKDHDDASQRNVNAPPVQLDLFQLARPLLPPDSGCGTLQPWEKTSSAMDGNNSCSERSAGKAPKVVNNFSASCYYNEDAGTINVTSNATNPVSGYAMFKGKRGATEELENEPGALSNVEEEGCSKKKLRLSREQCTLLEESFVKNRTPEPKQKRALALQLNLRPRQVEVWFQNRRARTKLKQTEVDCELLKRSNESLVEENRKLHNELKKLRALKMSSPLTPAGTLTMCPSCERVSTANNSSHFTLEKVHSMFKRGAFGP